MSIVFAMWPVLVHLVVMWVPMLLIPVAGYMGYKFVIKTVRMARHNAVVRAERAAYENYSAEIIDITHLLPNRNTPDGICS